MKGLKLKTIIKIFAVVSMFCVCCQMKADDETKRITVVYGYDINGQNREDNVPYEVYVNRSTGTLEIVSFDTKPATVYLCDAVGNIVNTLYIPEEGFYALQLPSGYSHLYIMIMSSDIYYGEITL